VMRQKLPEPLYTQGLREFFDASGMDNN
jgi:hypothetical protein